MRDAAFAWAAPRRPEIDDKNIFTGADLDRRAFDPALDGQRRGGITDAGSIHSQPAGEQNPK